MKTTHAGLLDSKVSSDVTSFASGSDIFHVSLQGRDQYCRVLDAFDPFAQRNAAWMRKGETVSERHAEAHHDSFHQLDSAA
jgi:hypothetical protein